MKHEPIYARTGGLLGLICSATVLAVPASALAQSQDSFDGLVEVPDSKVAVAYVDPDADFSVYNKVMILDTHVAFKKDWQRDQQRAGSHTRVSSEDMEEIKAAVAEMFKEVFAEKLSADGGYEIVDTAGDDVLLVRPAIIDLDIQAPDTMTAGRTRTVTATSGAATIYIELYDSVSGDILARAADRKASERMGGYMTYTNRVTNQADARKMLGAWAELLRGTLDEFHGK
jgi:hypothetical protein